MTTATMPAPASVTPPPVMVGPRPFRWTVKQFHDANERNLFGEGNRVILLKGELVEQGPMNPLHAQGIRRATPVINRLFGTGFFVQAQLPLVLGQDIDPIPDFAAVADNVDKYDAIHPSTAALVVEVADSSLFLDTTTKAELYATANILDYWVIDLQNRALLVYRDPAPVPDGGSAYGTTLTLTPADSVSPLAVPTAAVRVADLLP